MYSVIFIGFILVVELTFFFWVFCSTRFLIWLVFRDGYTTCSPNLLCFFYFAIEVFEKSMYILQFICFQNKLNERKVDIIQVSLKDNLPFSFLQKQPLEVFCKKDVLRNFAEFTGKHLCQSLFLIKLHVLDLQLY